MPTAAGFSIAAKLKFRTPFKSWNVIMAETPAKLDLRRLLQIGKRWKWLLIIPPILALIGAYFVVATTPPLYTSTTTIMLGSNLAILPGIQDVIGAQDKRQPKMSDRAENIRQEFLSESLLNKVVDRTGLKPTSGILERTQEILKNQPDANETEATRRQQIEWLIKRLETGITFPKRGNFIQISITHTNPETAYRLAETLAEVFIEESLEAESLGPRGTNAFASSELEKYMQKLEEAREKLRVHRTTMVQTQGRTFDVNMQNETQVTTQLKSLTVEVSEKRSLLLDLEKQLGEKQNQIVVQLSLKATGLRAQMLEKISNVAALMVRADWRDPQVIKLNQDIAALRDELQQEIQATGVNAASNGYAAADLDLAVQRQMILTDLDLLNRQKAVLDYLVQSYKQSLTLQPTQDLELNQLQNNVATYESIVKTFEEQKRGTEILANLRESDAEARYKISDRAKKPLLPDTSDQPKMLGMALFGGIGLGIGLVYLIEFFDHSFKTVEDVEQYLGLTVLGTVPKMDFDETSSGKRGQEVAA